jgi:AcrR family transcriptional regulator
MDSKISLKDQIVNETIKILSEGGIETLSLREVAKKLKVTHQAPYHYFSDKAALLKEVKKQGFKQLGEEMQQASLPKSLSPFKRLKKVGEAYLDFCTKNPGLFRVMFSPTSEKANERVPEAVAAFQILLEPIEQLQKEGYLKGDNPELIAMLGWTSMHGLVSLANENYPVLGGKFSIQQLSRMMLAQLHSLMGEKTNA